jgi:hypothetical protein
MAQNGDPFNGFEAPEGALRESFCVTGEKQL